jgi:hypothetical protein
MTLQVSTASDDASEHSSVDGSGNEVPQANEMETTQKDQVKEVQEMAKRETNKLRAWKFVVSLTVLVTATVVSTGTYIFLEGDELSNFKESYFSFANTIGNAAEVHTHNLFSTMRSCSSSISAAAIATKSEFPFVTVPTFEVLAKSVRLQSESELLIFTPKVELGELTQWEEYAIANEGWYEESKQLAVSSSALELSDFAPGRPVSFIYNTIVDENGNLSPGPPSNPPFFPIWHVSPPPFSPFLIKANIGGVLEFSSGLKAVDITREGVLGTTTFSDLYGLEGLASKEEDHEAFHAQFLVSSDTEAVYDRPHGYFFQPIFREIYNDTSEIVGTVTAVVPWDRYFAKLLPEGVKGITCVASNTCGQAFTYYLDGNNVSCAPFKT